MNKYLNMVVSAAVVAVYLVFLRYVVPSQEPYFILGTAVVGLVSWLCGSIAGLGTALLLVPLTTHLYNQFPVSISYSSFSSSPAYIAMQILAAFALGHLRKSMKKLDQKELELKMANERLRTMLSNVQEPGGIHNLCSHCKSIQDKDGVWRNIDLYLKEETKMEFSHCLCPQCAEHYHADDKTA